jgi:hypothetical protein
MLEVLEQAPSLSFTIFLSDFVLKVKKHEGHIFYGSLYLSFRNYNSFSEEKKNLFFTIRL